MQSNFSKRSTAGRPNDKAVRQGHIHVESKLAPLFAKVNSEHNGFSDKDAAEVHNEAATTLELPIYSPRPSGAITLKVSALGNSTLWTSSVMEEKYDLEPLSLHDAQRRAWLLYEGLAKTSDYLESAETVGDKLGSVHRQLRAAWDDGLEEDESVYYEAIRTLCDIYGRLGDYDKAQEIVESVCPRLPLNRFDLTTLNARHKIDALWQYLQFSAWTARNLDDAELAARILPWLSEQICLSKSLTEAVLFSLIQILNSQGSHEDASKHLRLFETMFPARCTLHYDYVLQRAIATAGQGLQEESQALFVDSVLLSSLDFGRWHIQTLNCLYHFGKALKAWKRHDSARKLLLNCCQGFYYTLGASHPLSIRAYKEIETLGSTDASIQSLRRLGHTRYGPRKKWSTAYMHHYLITTIEMLAPSVDLDHKRVTRLLNDILAQKDVVYPRRIFDTYRSLAWCYFEQKLIPQALAILSKLHNNVGEASSDAVPIEALHAILTSDKAIFSAADTGLGEGVTRLHSKEVYLILRKLPKRNNHQAKAVLQRMTMYNLTHLTHSVVFSDPPLISELNRESLGSGSSATVDTVRVGEKLYARKSINLPNQRQGRLREEIQNEIRAIHTLRHPHIVRVLLTYEEARRICIIIHPLAECDLETYLTSRACQGALDESRTHKWMVCLVNTLAFIHSKGIRHKDIKPRNILVKGVKVYFADFGSCYVFSDSGNSTTEGIAHGHTRAYCAPEVIKHTDRNRSSDVFSLGCVLAELVAWSNGIAMTEYFKCMSSNDDDGDSQPQYHDSTKRLKYWFRNCVNLTPRGKAVFAEIVRHMVKTKPEKRWTAVKVSQALRNYFSLDCEKGDLSLWVGDNSARQDS